MKKSLLNILTLAISIVNLVLMLILIFAIVPTAKKTDGLVTKICEAVDFELQNSYANSENSYVDIDSLTVLVSASGEQTVNLKSTDGFEHYTMYTLSIVMNTKHKDYETYSASVTEKDVLLNNTAREIIASHTMEELKNNTQAIQTEIKKAFQDMYRSDFIYDVQLTGLKWS